VKRAVAIVTLLGCLALAVSTCASSEEADLAGSNGRLRLAQVGDFEEPTYVAAPPGDRTRRFVVERAGRIVLLRKGRRSTFLDIGSRVQTGGESGLLSMAFHPDYARNRRYFVYYVANDGAIVIAQFRANRGRNGTIRGSGRTILRQPHTRVNHKGGQLQFGHDGMLYAGFGDGGGGGDPDDNAQDLSTLLGKIVRIDPKPNGGYRVPRDNPFAGPRAGRGEIFAYGVRNPYRFSFDRRTGDLIVGDVGQDAVEEVDFLDTAPGADRPRGGVNLGWPIFEGTRRYRSSGSAPGHVGPVIELFHDGDDACSITGGYVIRDRSLAALRGTYVYSDLCASRLRTARLGTGRASNRRTLDMSVPQIVSFGEDARGRVYVVSLRGGVFRLVAGR
jgi:glucose/arabinose dehydrogenase